MMLRMQELLAQFSQIMGAYLPKVAGALILLIVAWIVAAILRAVVRRVCRAARLDERAGSPVSGSLGDLAYWFTFLFFLPGILETLGLQQLLTPVQAMLGKVMNFLPNLLAAALIFVVGYFVARLVRRIVTNLLVAAGIDPFSVRIGMAPLLGQQLLSDILGLIVFAVMIVPVTYSALNALALNSVTQPVENVFTKVLSAVPGILTALVILLVAHFLGRLLGQVVTNFLTGVGFNSVLTHLGLPQRRDARTASEMVGSAVQFGVLLFALIEAAQALGFASVSNLVAQFTVFAGQLITGLLIFGAGLYLANLAVSAIEGSGLASASVLATAARVAICVLAGAMALRQMGLANEIVQLAFGLLLGAGAVAAALAFGLGGRESAAKVIEDWRHSWRARQAVERGAAASQFGD